MKRHVGTKSERAVCPSDHEKYPDLPDLSTIDPQELSTSTQAITPDEKKHCNGESTCASTEMAGPKSDFSPWNNDWLGQGSPRGKVIDAATTEAAYALRATRQGIYEDRRLPSLMETLRSRGEYRKLVTIPADWKNALLGLEKLFPNFGAVVEYLKVMYSLADHGDGVARLDPILLVGAPGCGKTYFAEYFARHYGSGCVTLRMETAQTNSQLAGSSEYWSNSRPGEVFNALLVGNLPFMNKVFVLDEIDKINAGQYDPLGAMLNLLEPATACTFTDLAYPWITLDASRLVVICTANDVGRLSAPLLDRLTRFEIGLPSEHQARNLVCQIHRDLGNELPEAAMALRLSPKVVESLATLSPRRIKQTLREGIGRALYRGHKRVMQQDLVIDYEDEFAEKRIGFL